MITFEWISPEQLKPQWPLIKSGLKKIESLSKTWITEDVYMSIKLGYCHLHVVTLDGNYVGFTVTQKQDNYGEAVLHIWAAYSEGNNFDILSQAIDNLKSFSKEINAKKITFNSSRPGWTKQAKKLGFTASPTITHEMRI